MLKAMNAKIIFWFWAVRLLNCCFWDSTAQTCALQAWQKVGCIFSWLLGCLPHWLWLSCGLARAIPFAWGRASCIHFLNTWLGGASVCAILVLELDPINLSGGGGNIDLFCGWCPMQHGGEIRIAVLEANAVVILGLKDSDSCNEGGVVYPLEKGTHASARINASITVILDALYLLVDFHGKQCTSGSCCAYFCPYTWGLATPLQVALPGAE